MSLDKKVSFYTLGCKVNQYETESIKEQFIKNGYTVCDFEEQADVYIINSCTVTSVADRKTRNILRRAKGLNPLGKVVVTGCYAQTDAKLLSKIEEIDLVVDNTYKDKMFGTINALFDKVESNQSANNLKLTTDKQVTKNIFDEKKYLDIEGATLRDNTRAFIKIQDGCNEFCSYCKIPFARGLSRSRAKESITNEVLALVEAGFKEVVLIGINIGDYGLDLDGTLTLESLTLDIAAVEGIERIRLGVSLPRPDNKWF